MILEAIILKLAVASMPLCEAYPETGPTTSCFGDVEVTQSGGYNAYARDGKVFITRGLIEQSSEAELAFVIAHEQAHIILGHTGSSPARELEADRLAGQMMRGAGFDPMAARGVFARTQGRRVMGFPFSLFTHPASSRRMAAIWNAVQLAK